MLLHRLYGAGHMDAAHYYERSQGLNTLVNALRRERSRILEDESHDDSIEKTEQILECLRNTSDDVGFDAICFDSLIDHIKVLSQNELVFHLINGLLLTERI